MNFEARFERSIAENGPNGFACCRENGVNFVI
jgi:hypothetical protein